MPFFLQFNEKDMEIGTITGSKFDSSSTNVKQCLNNA